MPLNTNYPSGNDLGQPTTLPPFIVNEPTSVIPGTWGWGGGGFPTTSDGDYIGGGGGPYVAPTPATPTQAPLQPGDPNDPNDPYGAIQRAIQQSNAARSIAGQLPLSGADLYPIIDQAVAGWQAAQQSGQNPNHGVINTTPSNTGGQGGIAIGIPGVIGIGLGGLVYGGALSGGGGGGGGSGGSAGGQTQNPTIAPAPFPEGSTPIYPGPYTPGSTQEMQGQGNPTIFPAPVAPSEGNPPAILPPVPPPTNGPAPVAPPPVNNPDGGPPGNPPIVPPVVPPGPTEPKPEPPIVPPVIPTTPTTPVTPQPTTNPTNNYTLNLPQYQLPTIPLDPMNRDYLREGQTSMNALTTLAPGMQQLYSSVAGAYGQSDFDRYAGLLPQVGAQNNYLTGQANLQTNLANTALRQGNYNDANSLGSQQLGLRQSLNQDLYDQMAMQSGRASQGIQANQYQSQLGQMLNGGGLQPSQLQTTLEQQAMDGLGLGRSLSQQDTRSAQQAARSAYAARGLGDSNSAMAAEVLNLDSMGRQRENERRTFAQSVDSQGFSQRAQGMGQNSSLGLNLANMDYGRQQQEFANQNTAIQNRTINAFDPFSSQYMANSQNVGTNQQLFNNTTSFSSGAQGNQYVQNAFNPYNNYSQDVYGSNFNAANARLISAQNNAAAIQGANTQANSNYISAGLQQFGPSIWNQIFGGVG